MRTGSLINHVYDNATGMMKPEIGMGATEILWTDRRACTIIEVSKTGHKVVVQRDDAYRVDNNGMSDAQTWRYERNPDGTIGTFTRRKDGTYRVKGGQGRLLIGVRDEYFDYSF